MKKALEFLKESFEFSHDHYEILPGVPVIHFKKIPLNDGRIELRLYMKGKEPLISIATPEEQIEAAAFALLYNIIYDKLAQQPLL